MRRFRLKKLEELIRKNMTILDTETLTVEHFDVGDTWCDYTIINMTYTSNSHVFKTVITITDNEIISFKSDLTIMYHDIKNIETALRGAISDYNKGGDL